MPAKFQLHCYYSVILLTLLLTISSTCLHAQKKSISPNTNWTLDARINGVTFYHVISTCEGKNVVFLRMINANKFNVEISWKEVFSTQHERELNGYLGEKKLVLQAGEFAETSCSNQKEKKLLVLPEQVNPTYVVQISKFDFKEIRVSRVN
jgi:hypothetical protein